YRELRRNFRTMFGSGAYLFAGVPKWMIAVGYAFVLYLWALLTLERHSPDSTALTFSGGAIYFYYSMTLLLYAKYQRDLHPDQYVHTYLAKLSKPRQPATEIQPAPRTAFDATLR